MFFSSKTFEPYTCYPLLDSSLEITLMNSVGNKSDGDLSAADNQENESMYIELRPYYKPIQSPYLCFILHLKCQHPPIRKSNKSGYEYLAPLFFIFWNQTLQALLHFCRKRAGKSFVHGVD